MKILSTPILLVLFFLSSLVPAWSQGQSQGHGHGKQNRDAQADDYDRPTVHGSIVFSTRDRDIIRDYFHGGYSNLPPGLAKRNGNLPPGLQKHLERDGTLPPGLQKRLTPFPYDLERRLPRLPDIYVRGRIGTDVVILNRNTQRILDVIHDVVRP